MISIDQKHYVYRRYRAGLETRDASSQLGNILTNTLWLAKSQYIKTNCQIVKGIFKKNENVNYFLEPSSNSFSIRELASEGSSITDPKGIVQKFNEYFSSVGDLLGGNIPANQVPDLELLGQPSPNAFFDAPETPSEFNTVLKLFYNKGSTTCKVFIFKLISRYPSDIICKLFNESFSVVFTTTAWRLREYPQFIRAVTNIRWQIIVRFSLHLWLLQFSRSSCKLLIEWFPSSQWHT